MANSNVLWSIYKKAIENNEADLAEKIKTELDIRKAKAIE